MAYGTPTRIAAFSRISDFSPNLSQAITRYIMCYLSLVRLQVVRVLCTYAFVRKIVRTIIQIFSFSKRMKVGKHSFVCRARRLIFCRLCGVDSDSSSDDDNGDLHPSPPNPKRAKAARSGAAKYITVGTTKTEKRFPFIRRGKTSPASMEERCQRLSPRKS